MIFSLCNRLIGLLLAAMLELARQAQVKTANERKVGKER